MDHQGQELDINDNSTPLKQRILRQRATLYNMLIDPMRRVARRCAKVWDDRAALDQLLFDSIPKRFDIERKIFESKRENSLLQCPFPEQINWECSLQKAVRLFQERILLRDILP